MLYITIIFTSVSSLQNILVQRFGIEKAFIFFYTFLELELAVSGALREVRTED